MGCLEDHKGSRWTDADYLSNGPITQIDLYVAWYHGIKSIVGIKVWYGTNGTNIRGSSYGTHVSIKIPHIITQVKLREV